MLQNRREFCCPECGLIWFDSIGVMNAHKCPECQNTKYICPCDSFVFEHVKRTLIEEYGYAIIHYAEGHPCHVKQAENK